MNSIFRFGMCVFLLMGILFSSPVLSYTVSYSNDTSTLSNPERGFYVHILHGGNFSHSNLLTYKNQGISIVLYQPYLTAFTSSAISAAFLTEFQNNLNSIRTEGMKTVLRFAYTSTNTADAPLSRVRSHLDQLQPYFASNTDIIMGLQCGFVGRWGEFQGSDNFGSDSWPPNLSTQSRADRKAVIDKCLAVLPANRFVQVRQPWIKREFYRTTPLQDNERFSGTDLARIGHFNDCFLDGSTDAGTYYNLTAEMPYLEQETKWLPLGGETCAEAAPRTNCPAALSEMARFHWSFLNSGYHQAVILTWQNDGCYNEIRNRLGYRFSLSSGQFPDSTVASRSFSFSLKLVNKGWAAPISGRDVNLVFRSISNPTQKYAIRLLDDLRLCLAGDTMTLDSVLTIPGSIPDDRYDVLLNLADPNSSLSIRPEYSIHLANQNVWESSTGYNRLFAKFRVGGASGIASDAQSAELKLTIFPNPFVSTVKFGVSSGIGGQSKVVVYDVNGRRVADLTSQMQKSEIVWNANHVVSGIYVVKIITQNKTLSKTFTLVK